MRDFVYTLLHSGPMLWLYGLLDQLFDGHSVDDLSVMLTCLAVVVMFAAPGFVILVWPVFRLIGAIFIVSVIAFGLSATVTYRDMFVECQPVPSVITYEFDGKSDTVQSDRVIKMCHSRLIGSNQWQPWERIINLKTS